MTQTLSVSLPSKVIYCSGTVNGVDYVWTNVADNVWETQVARAENETYDVELTLVDDAGVTSTRKFTLYYGLLNLITDRTEADKAYWVKLRDKGWAAMTEAEKSAWRSPLKGGYNYTDMNRVESAVQYLSRRMRELGYLVSPTTKTTWSMSDIPTRADMDRYFGNVARLRSLLTVYKTTPLPTTTNKRFTYQDANDLEKILIDIDELLTKLSLSWFYSGEIFVGEV